METITLEINKRTKDGKTLLDMIEFYLANAKGVKIKKEDSKNIDESYPVSANEPNAVTLRSMEKTKKRVDLTHCDSAEDMFKKLGI